MPFQPGSPASQMPAGDDAIIRRIQEIERTVRELSASVAPSVQSIVAAQIGAGSARSTRTSFALTAGMNTIETATLAVPEWAGRAIVTVTAALLVHDMTTGGAAFVDVRVGIGGNYSTAMIAPVTVGASVAPNMITLPHVHEVTNPAATIACVIQAQPSNAAAYPTNAGNVATVNVIGLFLR